jgi:hypothetical protein
MGNTNENSQPSGGNQEPVAPAPTESLPAPERPIPPPDRIEKGNKGLPESVEQR